MWQITSKYRNWKQWSFNYLSFCESGVWGHLSRVPLAQGLSWNCSGLETWLGLKDLLPSSHTWLLASLAPSPHGPLTRAASQCDSWFSPGKKFWNRARESAQDRSYSLCLSQPQKSYPITSTIFYSLKQVSEFNPSSRGGDYSRAWMSESQQWWPAQRLPPIPRSLPKPQDSKVSWAWDLCGDPCTGFCLSHPLIMMLSLFSHTGE